MTPTIFYIDLDNQCLTGDPAAATGSRPRVELVADRILAVHLTFVSDGEVIDVIDYDSCTVAVGGLRNAWATTTTWTEVTDADGPILNYLSGTLDLTTANVAGGIGVKSSVTAWLDIHLIHDGVSVAKIVEPITLHNPVMP